MQITQLCYNIDFGDFALFPCGDPRDIEELKDGLIQPPPGSKPLDQHLTETMAKGHYLLLKYHTTSLIQEHEIAGLTRSFRQKIWIPMYLAKAPF